MPNHCHNRVTIWSEDQATIENLKNLFEDENEYIQQVLQMIADDSELGSSNPNYVKIQARYNK